MDFNMIDVYIIEWVDYDSVADETYHFTEVALRISNTDIFLEEDSKGKVVFIPWTDIFWKHVKEGHTKLTRIGNL